MNISDLESFSEQEQSRRLIANNPDFRGLLDQLSALKEFLNDLDSLFDGRDFVFIPGITPFSPGGIIYSATKTISSMTFCCESGHFGDAYTLLRKLRDDLFFYLYVIAVSNRINTPSEEKSIKHVQNIKKWIHNELDNLQITEILKYLGTYSDDDADSLNPKKSESILEKAVTKYSLKKSFDRIGITLNNYVHTNGIAYLTHPISHYLSANSKAYADEIIRTTDYIMTAFVFLLILLRGNLIMSSDHIDALDFQQEPENGSQYWVAPFVKEFIQNHIGLLGDDCDKFLKEATYMEIQTKQNNL